MWPLMTARRVAIEDGELEVVDWGSGEPVVLVQTALTADARALLAAMGIERAHVVGVSFISAIALQLAADAPDITHSLTVAEPPPVHSAHGPEFRAANERLLRTRREQGVDAALEEFLTLLVGPNWRDQVEVDLPGAVAPIERDAATFFDTDIPA
jgi:pimeloyl-ACP methyl ester carboxylesterase